MKSKLTLVILTILCLAGVSLAQTKSAKKPAKAKAPATAAPYTGESEFSMTRYYEKHYPDKNPIEVIKSFGFTEQYEVIQPLPVESVQTYYPAMDKYEMKPAVSPVPVGFKLLRKPNTDYFVVVYQPIAGGGQKRACFNKVKCPPDLDYGKYVRRIVVAPPPVVRNEPPPEKAPPPPVKKKTPNPCPDCFPTAPPAPKVAVCDFRSEIRPSMSRGLVRFVKALPRNMGKGLVTGGLGAGLSGGDVYSRVLGGTTSFGITTVGGAFLDAKYPNVNTVELFFNGGSAGKFKKSELEQAGNSLPIKHGNFNGFLRYNPQANVWSTDFGKGNESCGYQMISAINRNHFYNVNTRHVDTKIVKELVPGPAPAPNPTPVPCKGCKPPPSPNPPPAPTPKPNPPPAPTPKPNPPPPAPKPNPTPAPGPCTGNCSPVTPPSPPTQPPARDLPTKTQTTPVRSPG